MSANNVCRRVLDPFKVQLRISKSANAGHVNSPEKGRAPGSPVVQASQGQEIRLIMPQIGAIMDSKEFEVLTDVISNVGMAQVGTPLVSIGDFPLDSCQPYMCIISSSLYVYCPSGNSHAILRLQPVIAHCILHISFCMSS